MSLEVRRGQGSRWNWRAGGCEASSRSYVSPYLASCESEFQANSDFILAERCCGYSIYCQTLLVLCGPSGCLITCPLQFAFWLRLIQNGNSITDFQNLQPLCLSMDKVMKTCVCHGLQCFFRVAPVSPEVSALLVPEGTVCHHTLPCLSLWVSC